MGIPLYNIKDVRTMYGVDPFGKEPIDFDKYFDFYLFNDLNCIF